MEFDNGIRLKNYKQHILPEYVLDNSDQIIFNENELELCYWRKHWSLRKDIFDRIHAVGAMDGGITNLDAEDVEAIKKILIQYLDRKYWEDGHDDCIWDYDVAKGNILSCIINLVWLADYMKISDKPVEVYFYDSY